MNKPRIVLTGGHLTPALALIEILEKEGWEIIFFGRQNTGEGDKKKSIEAEIIPARGIRFIPITTGKLYRKFSLEAVISLMKIPAGISQCLYWLIEVKPKALVSFGGYLGLPAVIGAWILRIPCLIHEQTMVAGLANRISAKFVNRITVSFPESARHFPLVKTVVIGNPVQPGVFTKEITLEKKLGGKLKHKKTILVMGGNQGAKIINQATIEALFELLEEYNIVHVFGNSSDQNQEWQEAQKLLIKLPEKLKINYWPMRYIPPEQMGIYYNLADLVVCRSGANTIYELGLLNKPAILIPLEPSLMNEQLHNARLLEKYGLALILRESDLTGESLKMKTDEAFEKIPTLKLALEAKKIFIEDAAENLYAEVEKLTRSKDD